MQSLRGRVNAALQDWGPRDPLVRAMVVNWAFGMATGVFCALLLLAFDFFGLRSLLVRSDVLIGGVAMLCAAFAFTFGGVICAAAVMSFGADESGNRPRGLKMRIARAPRALVAAVVIAPLPRR